MTLFPDKNFADLHRASCYPHITSALFTVKSAWFHLLVVFRMPSFKALYTTDQICTFIILTLMPEAALPFRTSECTSKTNKTMMLMAVD
jgi:hypothetical protein